MTPEEFNALPKSTKKGFPVSLPILVIGGLLLMVVSFLGGTMYQRSNQPNGTAVAGSQNLNANNGQSFGGASGRGTRQFRGILGQVTSVSSNSITVQDLRSNSTYTLTVDASTVITNAGQASSISDVKVGDNVAVRLNSTDNKIAASINLNPKFPGGTSPSANAQSN